MPQFRKKENHSFCASFSHDVPKNKLKVFTVKYLPDTTSSVFWSTNLF